MSRKEKKKGKEKNRRMDRKNEMASQNENKGRENQKRMERKNGDNW